jgi:hypothetical protein
MHSAILWANSEMWTVDYYLAQSRGRTYLVSDRYGLIAYGSSLDCVGPLATCVEDAALILNAISGCSPLPARRSTVVATISRA